MQNIYYDPKICTRHVLNWEKKLVKIDIHTGTKLIYKYINALMITWISGSATTNCFSIRFPKARDIAKTPPTLQVPIKNTKAKI